MKLLVSKCAILSIFLCTASVVFAQRKESLGSLKGKGAVFIELLGNGSWYSLNYDRVFYHRKRNALTWRAGLAYWPYSNGMIKTGTTVYVGEFNYLRGKAPHFLESGIGLTHWWIFGLDNDKYIRNYLLARIGYRYQKPGGGFFFRVGATPGIYLERNIDRNYILWGGLSFGFTIKSSGKKTLAKSHSEAP